MHYCFEPIGLIRSCFTEKFGIPRQPNLVEAHATLEILPPYHQAEAFRELDGFSHVWLIFVFHRCYQRPWKATVRPPRLGGNRRVGVFASRSGFRPNAIGQSAVSLLGLESGKGKLRLHLGGVDLLDGTPVLDVKPYLPYADSITGAQTGYAPMPAADLKVVFSPAAECSCRLLEQTAYPGLTRLIQAVLAQDPRPAYTGAETQRQYGVRLWDLNIRFQCEAVM